MRQIALVLLFGLLILSACSSVQEEPGPNEPAGLSIRTSNGTVSLTVEVADTPQERRRGLMDREHLYPYDGMAFVWSQPVEATFWMKDTLIPLSIAFWDEDGRIISILDMSPCAEESCPSYGPGEPFVGAVEVRRGDLDHRGVQVGDAVTLHTTNA